MSGKPFDFRSLLPEDLVSVHKTEEEWAEHDKAVRASVAADRKREHAERRNQMKTVLLAMGAPARRLEFADSPDYDDTRPGPLALNSWDPEVRPIVVLSGGTGTGKTVAALRWLLDNGGRTPVFMRAADFERRGRYDKTRHEVIASASSMLLDDLGGEHADRSRNFMGDLDTFLDRWAGSRGALIVTTNGSGEEFLKRYDRKRIISRLKESGVWIPVTGEDMRGK